MLTVTCSACSARFQAPDAAAGKFAKCPKCENVIQISVSDIAGTALPSSLPPPLPTLGNAPSSDTMNPQQPPCKCPSFLAQVKSFLRSKGLTIAEPVQMTLGVGGSGAMLLSVFCSYSRGIGTSRGIVLGCLTLFALVAVSARKFDRLIIPGLASLALAIITFFQTGLSIEFLSLLFGASAILAVGVLPIADANAPPLFVRIEQFTREKGFTITEPTRMKLGLGGSVALLISVFCFPVIHVPIVGGLPCITCNGFIGALLIFSAIAALIASVGKSPRWLMISGAVSIVAILVFFVAFELRMFGISREAGDSLGTGLAVAIHLDWGFPVLLLGSLAMFAAGLLPDKIEDVPQSPQQATNSPT